MKLLLKVDEKWENLSTVDNSSQKLIRIFSKNIQIEAPKSRFFSDGCNLIFSTGMDNRNSKTSC